MEGSESRKDVKSRNGEKPVWTPESEGESGVKRRVKRGPPDTGSVCHAKDAQLVSLRAVGCH